MRWRGRSGGNYDEEGAIDREKEEKKKRQTFEFRWTGRKITLKKSEEEGGGETLR